LCKYPHISVVVPVYGCSECLILLTKRLEDSLLSISPDYEIILVNDSSPDFSWNVIKDVAGKNPKIKGINFSRNFGQHYAISAGLDFASGEWVVVMDCDLQDQPEEIKKLYNRALEGYDIVYGVSEFRGKRNFITKLLRVVYFKLYDFFANNNFKTENLSFYIISRNVRNNMVLFREHSRHISSIMRHVGFKIIGIPIDHKEREFGKSTYNFSKRVKLALVGLIAHSSTLLRFSFYLGFIFSFFSFSYGIYILFIKIFMSYSVPGFTSLATLIAFSTGLILTVLGIIGIYLENIYLETKNRPLYIVKDYINIESK
jgi:dolichol-phosphate mannosyltransferase